MNVPVMLGIGDVTSSEKGSGARYNAGKPDLSLIPLTLIADSFAGCRIDYPDARDALFLLGQFQLTGNRDRLYEAIRCLGLSGWPECAKVFEFGLHKYAPWNWAKGMPWSVPLACAARHIVLGLLRGEVHDPESGETHRGHIFCNIVMLLTYIETYPEGNDLPLAMFDKAPQ